MIRKSENRSVHAGSPVKAALGLHLSISVKLISVEVSVFRDFIAKGEVNTTPVSRAPEGE